MDEVLYRTPRLDRARLRELEIRSDAAGLLRLTGHAATLFATGWILTLSLGTVWVIPAILLHGAVLVFLFSALHESVHRTAFGSRWLNDAVAWICGAVLLLPPDYFRRFHFAHHRHTQDPARDPELAIPKPATFGAWLLHVSGLPYWSANLVAVLRHARGRVSEPFIPPRAAPGIVREARLLLALYAAIVIVSALAGSPAALVYWVIPILLGQPLLRMFLMAEHAGCPLVPDMLANTRTTLTNAVLRFFTWNMPFHAEHHAFPSVPFHRLPAVHQALAPDLEVVTPGYLAVQREILRALPRRERAPAH
jgi:fatty acid desaturase